MADQLLGKYLLLFIAYGVDYTFSNEFHCKLKHYESYCLIQIQRAQSSVKCRYKWKTNFYKVILKCH